MPFSYSHCIFTNCCCNSFICISIDAVGFRCATFRVKSALIPGNNQFGIFYKANAFILLYSLLFFFILYPVAKIQQISE